MQESSVVKWVYQEPKSEHERAVEMLLCFTELKPVLDYAAPFPGRQADRLTSPTDYPTRKRNTHAGGERNNQ